MTTHARATATTDTPAVAAPTLQRACACGETAGISGKCPSCAADERLGVQPKLRINPSGDRWEQEADRIADHVVADRPAALTGPLPITPLVQRQPEEDEEEDLQAKRTLQRQPIEEEGEELQPKLALQRQPIQEEGEVQSKPEGLQRQAEEEEEEEEELQAKSAGGTPTGPAIGRAAAAVSGGGRPLSRVERAWFELRLGRDLSPVRIHDDATAGAAARGIHARAYTLRNHIAFAPAAYDGTSTEGRRLMTHELVHTIQQGYGGPGDARSADGIGRISRAPRSIQRLLSPVPGGGAVCRRPPSARRLGTEVHKQMQSSFVSGGSGRISELDLPFTDTAACKATDRDRHEPPTSKGRPDLAIAVRSSKKVTVRLGEIKPYNVSGVSAGAGVMECYERGISRNADVCKAGESAIEGTREAAALKFCHQLKAFGKDVELGPPILWNPGPVTAFGRAIATINIGGGLIFYACPDELKKHQKKKKKKKAEGKKKAKGKSAAKLAKKSAAKGAKKDVTKKALKKGGEQVAKGVGKKAALKGVGKKLIPGAAWIEAAAFATALLAGAKPSFGGEGMSAEEALLEIAKSGVPPDVKISEELQELLKENPDVLERLRAAAGGEAISDEAAQKMIDMLEANKDLLDAETLEGIAALAESSGEPRLAKTAAEYRKTLEAIKAGKKPTGESEGEAEAKLETEAEPEPEAKPEMAEKEGEAKKAEGSGLKLPEDFKKELKAQKPLSELFEEVLDRSKKEGIAEAEVERFRKAVAGLTDEQLKQILEYVAKLPTVEPESREPKQKVLDIVVDLAAKMAAGAKAPPEPKAAEPQGAPQPAAPAAGAGGAIVLDETKLKWIRKAIRRVQPPKPASRVQIALTKETAQERIAEISEKARAVKEGEEAELGTLPAAFASKLKEKGAPDTIGSFVTISVRSLKGTKMTVTIVASSELVDKKGQTHTGPSPVGRKFVINLPKGVVKGTRKKK